ncbi:MAG: YlaI family protein [Firmicutes bacterium]|nr:YlaI family protein [Bacillota bacterium]
MQLKCQLCGAVDEVTVWSHEYESQKRAPNTPYICPRCRDRIQVEAREQQKPRGH